LQQRRVLSRKTRNVAAAMYMKERRTILCAGRGINKDEPDLRGASRTWNTFFEGLWSGRGKSRQ